MRQRRVLKEIAKDLNIKQTAVKKVVDCFIENIQKQLLDKNAVNIKEFGQFFLHECKEKKAVIPGKKQPIIIPSHLKAQFKAFNHFKDRINQLEKSD